MSGLDKFTKNQLIQVFSQYPAIQRVVLFGSRARGDYKYNSDIDLAIVALENLPAEFYLAIDEAAGILKVDIIELKKLNNNKLRQKIEEEGIEIYSVL